MTEPPRNIQGLDLGTLHIWSSLQFDLHVGPLTIGAGTVSDSVFYHLISFIYLDYQIGTQWKMRCLALLMVWFLSGAFSSLKKGVRIMGGGILKGRIRRKGAVESVCIFDAM